MALNPEFIPVELSDSLFAFPQGMNAGIAAVLLPKTQLSFLTNGTVRGDFPVHRPPYRKMNLSFDSPTTQTNFQTAKFQGAGMFNPIAAGDCVQVSIGGNLFQVTPGLDINATVTNANPPNDFNPPGPNQVWIFQTERWTIINDGVSIPLVSDGLGTRRAIAAGFVLQVQNVDDPNVGTNYPTGTTVTMIGNQISSLYAGQTCLGFNGTSRPFGPTFVYSWPTGLPAGNSYLFGVNSGTFFAGQQVIIGNDLWSITASGQFTPTQNVSGHQACPFTFIPPKPDFNATNLTTLASPTSYPNAAPVFTGIQAQIIASVPPFVVPAQGARTNLHLSQSYVGAINGPIFINGHQYIVTALVSTGYPAVAVELPPGKMGCNAGGRTWMALPDGKSYIASDLTGDQSSGTITYQFTDAVLHMTENTLLAGGGAFRIPSPNGNISAIIPTATLDSSLGQGPLEVLSPTQVFSCNAPADRTQWQNITYPIQSVSLLGAGGLSQWSTINANSDTLFRSLDGIRSLVLARRDFDVWGNVPYSEEVEPIIVSDNKNLLQFSSAISFDNRALITANPQQHAQGVYHNRLIALNYDPVASLTGKAPSVYDGIWTGLNVLQLVTGTFNGVQRAFAFVLNLNSTPVIEFWEILNTPPDPDFLPINELDQWSDPVNHFDNSLEPIPMALIGPVLDFGQKDPKTRKYLQLNNGEIYVDHMTGTVLFEVWYKPDDYPFWTLWLRWTETSTPNPGGFPQFRPRMGLGTPTGKDCDTTTNRPLREGYLFQLKVIIVGNARFRGAKIGVVTIPQPKYAPPNCATLLTPGP